MIAIILSLLFLAGFLQAAPIVEIRGVSATQVKVVVTDNFTPCTFQISKSSTFSPLLPDVDPAVFAGSDTEASHIKLPTWSSGANLVRQMLFGKRTSEVSGGLRVSRSLTADTNYWLKTVCGSGTIITTFRTKSIRGIVPEEPPLDATAFEQTAFPEFDDFSKSITDNKGSEIVTQDPNAWGVTRVAAISTLAYQSIGAGWTGNVTPYLGAGATTTNANATFIHLDTAHSEAGDLWYNDGQSSGSGYWYDNWTDLAVDIHGIATLGTGNLAKLDLCLSIDSGQTCYSPHQHATLPTGSAGNVQVPNTTDGSAANYPTAYFKGWGKRIDRKFWEHAGYVTVNTSSVVTLTKNVVGPFSDTEAIGAGPISDNAYFDITWTAGTKIFILGSSAVSGGTCVNDYCTIASVTDAFHLVLSETIGTALTGDNFYLSAAVGVIIKRLDASSGSVTFSAQFHIAKSYPFNLGFYGGTALTTVTAADGAVGYPAVFSGLGNWRGPRIGPGALFFVSTTGPGSPALRFISPFSWGGACSQGSDCPQTSSLFNPKGAWFNQSDPSKIYFMTTSQAGKLSLFEATYNAGTYGWLPYSSWQTSYGSSTYTPPNTGELSYVNLTPGSNDVGSQITAALPLYNASAFGTSPAIRATMGPFVLMDVGGQNGVGWVHVFCITNTGPCAGTGAGKWYKSYNTMDSAYYGGTDPTPAGLLRYSGNHATSVTFGSNDTNGYTMVIATHSKQEGNASFQGGPFSTTISALSRGGVMVSTGTGLGTALPWPINSTYDNACPGGLPPWLVTYGATTPNCIKVRAQMPCNTFAGATEAGLRPCPYNSAWSYNGGFQVGDFFKDSALYSIFGQVGDNEGFMVLTTPVLITGSTYEFYALRDANRSYCSTVHDGAASAGQSTHGDGWTVTMWPREACDGGSTPMIDIVNDVYVVPNFNMSIGHGGTVAVGSKSVSAGQNPGLFNRIGSGAAGGYQFANNRAFIDMWKSADGQSAQQPAFAGLSGNCCQSYIDAKAPTATPAMKEYSFDWGHFDPNNGGELEYPGATLGSATNLTLVAGTTGVYEMTVSTNGTGGSAVIDVKRSPIFAWAGTKYFIDISNPTTSSHQITDSVRWVKCYALNNGECRTNSIAGKFYISMPANAKWPINYGSCTTSQMNVREPCAFSATGQGGQLRLVYSAATDDLATKQIYLGWGGAGPEHQQVYSNFIPTPDGLYGLYPMLGMSGYHSGIMMIKLPDVSRLDSVNRTSFIPVRVTGSGGVGAYVEFGYEEFGYDGANKFYCRSRAENCKVASSTINESIPFKFAAEALTGQTGAIDIAIPALPGYTVYYHLVNNGVAGPTQFEVIP